ncbi:hypothetical protein CCP3SC1_820007 [Gammaproteobacteria bacterium]
MFSVFKKSTMMSEHNCSCGCKPVVVQCGFAGGCDSPLAPTIRYSCINDGQCVPDQNGAYPNLAVCQESCRVHPPPKSVCDKIRVSFVSLTVSDDGDNGNGDWTLQFDVNGLVASYAFPDDAIDDTLNIAYPINQEIIVPIDALTPQLDIRITGVERDGGFNGADDSLVTAERTFGSAENFGIGGVYDITSGPSCGDAIGGYSVRARIECLTLTTSVVSIETLREASIWRLERENAKRLRLRLPALHIDEAALLDRSIGYLRANGWILKTIYGENFIFEGVGKRIDLRVRDPRSKFSKHAEAT